MSGRAQRAVGLLPDAGLDAMLVTDLVNVRYLTGYTGSNGLALIGESGCTFVTDFRYVEQAAAEVAPEFDRRRGERDLLEAVEDPLPGGPVRRDGLATRSSGSFSSATVSAAGTFGAAGTAVTVAAASGRGPNTP